MSNVVTGQRIKVQYSEKEFEVIVIDPNGLGQRMPSVGLGFRMIEKYAGIPHDTLAKWTGANQGQHWMKLPSGKTLRVVRLLGLDGNDYSVIEASDWFDMCFDILEHPGKIGAPTKVKVLKFLKWFAIKGFYSEAYVAIKGVYTAKDSRATTSWLESRASGVPIRKRYTDCLQLAGCKTFDYARWTNVIYQGLFGMTSKDMIAVWDCVDGTARIGRNHIGKEEGLRAVAFCEKLTVEMYVDNLAEAHTDAIKLTRRKHLNLA